MKREAWERVLSRQAKIVSTEDATLGDKLKHMRLKKKKTVQQAAAEMGIGYMSLYWWENDKACLKYDSFLKIISYYGVEAKELLR